MRIVITLKSGETRDFDNIDFVFDRGEDLKIGLIDSPLYYLFDIKDIEEVRAYLL